MLVTILFSLCTNCFRTVRQYGQRAIFRSQRDLSVLSSALDVDFSSSLASKINTPTFQQFDLTDYALNYEPVSPRILNRYDIF